MSLSNPVLRDDIFLREDEREVSMAGMNIQVLWPMLFC